MTVRFEDGSELARVIELLPFARVTIPMGAAFPEASGRHYSVLIESVDARVPLAVECARYWSTGGQAWAAGVSALATPVP